MKDLVGWQSKGKQRTHSRKLPVSRQLATSMGGLLWYTKSTNVRRLISFHSNLSTGKQIKAEQANQIRFNMHAVRECFYNSFFFFKKRKTFAKKFNK